MRVYLSTDQKALASLCAGLLIFFAYETMSSVPKYDVPVVSLDRPLPKAATAPSFLPPAIETFSEIDSRPLLSPTRKPIPVPETPAKDPLAPPPPPKSQLVGIIIDSSSRIAILRAGTETLGTTVLVGGMIEGWQVTEIDPDKIIVKNGNTPLEMHPDFHRNPENPSAAPGSAPAPGNGVPDTFPSSSPEPQPRPASQ